MFIIFNRSIHIIIKFWKANQKDVCLSLLVWCKSFVKYIVNKFLVYTDSINVNANFFQRFMYLLWKLFLRDMLNTRVESNKPISYPQTLRRLPFTNSHLFNLLLTKIIYISPDGSGSIHYKIQWNLIGQSWNLSTNLLITWLRN